MHYLNDLEKAVGSAGLAAIVAAAVSALFSYFVSSRSNYINAVTVERSKWIEKLRENLSTFAGYAAYLHYELLKETLYVKSPEHDELVQKVEKIGALLQLQLNPLGEIEKNLVALIEKLPSLADNPLREQFREVHSLLIQHGQWLLKDEWETVKTEARGFLVGLYYRHKRNRQMRQYREFCRDTELLQKLAPARAPAPSTRQVD